MDRLVKLAEHAGPIRIFVKLRKPLCKVRTLFKDLEIAFYGRLQIRPLDLYRDLFAGMQPRTINLAQRSRGNGCDLKLTVYVRDLLSELRLDPRKGDLVRKWRHLIHQGAKLS